MLEPYAITTARRMIASMWRSQDTQRQEELDDVIAAGSAFLSKCWPRMR